MKQHFLTTLLLAVCLLTSPTLAQIGIGVGGIGVTVLGSSSLIGITSATTAAAVVTTTTAAPTTTTAAPTTTTAAAATTTAAGGATTSATGNTVVFNINGICLPRRPLSLLLPLLPLRLAPLPPRPPMLEAAGVAVEAMSTSDVESESVSAQASAFGEPVDSELALVPESVVLELSVLSLAQRSTLPAISLDLP
uniref:Uncharacterized protein n=1 Tax=Anopheles farauti TaxID=69004 RepID=A0A182QXH0_9DIPT